MLPLTLTGTCTKTVALHNFPKSDTCINDEKIHENQKNIEIHKWHLVFLAREVVSS